MTIYKDGDYIVFKSANDFKGILLILTDIKLKKVFAPMLRVNVYILDFDDVRLATEKEISQGYRDE